MNKGKKRENLERWNKVIKVETKKAEGQKGGNEQMQKGRNAEMNKVGM